MLGGGVARWLEFDNAQMKIKIKKKSNNKNNSRYYWVFGLRPQTTITTNSFNAYDLNIYSKL